jgi:hypothetical protein
MIWSLGLVGLDADCSHGFLLQSGRSVQGDAGLGQRLAELGGQLIEGAECRSAPLQMPRDALAWTATVP